jgi:hypothetical protein
MRLLQQQIAVRIATPSPLVGEGSTASRSELGWVRGSLADLAMQRQPLTRLHFAQPPSPTRGEGKKRAPHTSQSA